MLMKSFLSFILFIVSTLIREFTVHMWMLNSSPSLWLSIYIRRMNGWLRFKTWVPKSRPRTQECVWWHHIMSLQSAHQRLIFSNMLDYWPQFSLKFTFVLVQELFYYFFMLPLFKNINIKLSIILLISLKY